MTRAVFLGSSLIAGDSLLNTADRFSTVAAGILGWNEINMGRRESRVAGRDVDGRIIDDCSGAARVLGVEAEHPNIVVLLFGDEDFAGSTLAGERRIGLGLDSVSRIPGITSERRRLKRLPPARSMVATTDALSVAAQPDIVVQSLVRGAKARPGTFAGDYDFILTHLTKTRPPGRIYLITPPYSPVGDTPNSVGLRLRDYADAARAIARQHEIVVVDAYRDSTIQAATFADMSDDGIALNARGHQHLAAFVIERLLI